MPDRSSTTRSGDRPATRRTFNKGSSFSTVRLPAMMACSSLRQRCTRTSVVKQLMRGAWPFRTGWRSRNASALCAHFRMTWGRCRSAAVMKRRFSQRASSRSTSVITAMPASRSLARPRPLTRGSGSVQATTTVRTPRAISRSAQGGVRPVCAQGSSETYSTASCGTGPSPKARRHSTSACGAPWARCQPSASTPSPCTSTAPTIGLGAARPAPFAASCRQRRIQCAWSMPPRSCMRNGDRPVVNGFPAGA